MKSMRFLGIPIKCCGGITGTGVGNGVLIRKGKHFVAIDHAGKDKGYFVKGFYARDGSIHITESGALNSEDTNAKS